VLKLPQLVVAVVLAQGLGQVPGGLVAKQVVHVLAVAAVQGARV
jgi:hypothetical protein